MEAETKESASAGREAGDRAGIAGHPVGRLRSRFASAPARERWGWAAIAAGFVLLLWSVLHLTSATIGGPIHEFKDRRTYTQVKQATHRALAVTILLGAAGGGLLFLGARLRAAGRGTRLRP